MRKRYRRGEDASGKRRWLGQVSGGLAAAWALLLAVPLPRRLWPDKPVRPAEAIWAFPLIGTLVGVLAGAAFGTMGALGLPVPLAVIAALGAGILATGGLHEDGLADMADGFGGGWTRARKLEIMHDSRLGSYGALALAGGLAARGFALAALPGAAVGAALVVCHALARAAIAVPFYVFPTVRAPATGSKSVSQEAGRPGALGSLAALCLALGIAAALVPLKAALAAMLAGLLGALAAGLLARRQIGGVTGDVLGAAEQIAEICVLWALVAQLSAGGSGT